MDLETRIQQYELCKSLIEQHYKTDTARRSGVLLMNHVNEGVAILNAIEGDYFSLSQSAFLIHPIVQNNEDIDLSAVHSDIVALAEEYRYVANSYLCKPSNDNIKTPELLRKLIGSKMSTECLLMLYADKVQNKKDFLLYHRDTHDRRVELSNYFDNWIAFLKEELNNRAYKSALQLN